MENAEYNYNVKRREVIDTITSLENDECIGFYPPLRAMPYLTEFVDQEHVIKRLRFIDDNKLAENKYMCNVKIPILPLLHPDNKQCKIIFVASKAYRRTMTEKIEKRLDETEVRYI